MFRNIRETISNFIFIIISIDKTGKTSGEFKTSMLETHFSRKVTITENEIPGTDIIDPS